MAGKAFTNLNKIFLSDTFRAWFDKTNQIVSTINPLEIYGVTSGSGNIAGISMEYGTNGIVTIGLDLPDALTGDFTFNTGVTFGNFVSVSGLTVDFAPNGGLGATLTGRVVRSVNGSHGDVTLDFVGIPGNSSDGDILYYENTPVGATFRTYNLFSDGTAEREGPLHIGGSGGVFFGITAGGATSAQSFVKLGNIQLVGATSSGVYLVDNSQATLATAKIAGADVRYGTKGTSQLFTIGGRNLTGVEHSVKNLILDFNRHSIAVGGADVSSVGTTNGIVDIRDTSNIGVPINYTDNSGSTFAIRYLLKGENSGRNSGGSAGVASFAGNPSTRGLHDVDKRIRLENVDGSVEIEITGSGNTSGFVVYGKDTPYGNLLLPALTTRRDGEVVIGGIRKEDGGITGTTYGGLNIASGQFRVGGSAGKLVSSGYQVLHSSGISASWKTLESTAFSYSGAIGSAAAAHLVTGAVVLDIVGQPGNKIRCLDQNGNPQAGPFSANIRFPEVKMKGSITDNTGDAVLGIRLIKDKTKIEDKYILFTDLLEDGLMSEYSGNRIVSPTFTFSGVASESVEFLPFMTKPDDFGESPRGFVHVSQGAFLINFHKLG